MTRNRKEKQAARALSAVLNISYTAALRSLRAESGAPNCPDGHGKLLWAEDAWFCPTCKDEFGLKSIAKSSDLE